MTSSVAISFAHVTKTYPSYHHVTGGIKTFLFNLAQSIRELRQRTLALEDITLEIKQGETFGFIGRNGAGKSTTLGLIAGVLFPDSGTITVNGRISPLLELGAGFHPELTGRENIRLNGVLMGLRAHEVDAQLQEIIDFSTLGNFIDQPVRTYSSGMYAKLGFSVVATLRPEILLIDEILAVGDYAFTMRCTERMEKFRADPSVTMVLVSHSLEAVSTICDRAAWIENHQIRKIGPADEVVRAYTEATKGSIQSVVPEQLDQLPPHLVPSKEQVCLVDGEARLDVTPLCHAQDSYLDVIICSIDGTTMVQHWNFNLVDSTVSLAFHHDGEQFSLSVDGNGINGILKQNPVQDGAATPAVDRPMILDMALSDHEGARASMAVTLPMSVTQTARRQHEARRYAALSTAPRYARSGAARRPGPHTPLQAPLWTSKRTVRVVARNIFPRDAVGQFALDTAGFFLSSGVDVRLYAHAYPAELSGIVQPIGRLQHDLRVDDVLFYNYSIEDEFLPVTASLPCKKVLYYHNVTPSEYYRPYDARFADLLDRSRGQFKMFHAFDAVLANSSYSLEELNGYLKEEAFKAASPPLLSPTNLETALADEAMQLPVSGKYLLWVGRIAPHKRPDFALRLFAALGAALADYSLVLVGSGYHAFPSFGKELDSIRVALPNALQQRIHFLEGITDAALHALYADAEALVVTSRHEGFCLPLYEAMRSGTLIFSTPLAGTEDILAGACKYLEDDPQQAAVQCMEVLQTPETATELRRKSRFRGCELAAASTGERLWEAVESALRI